MYIRKRITKCSKSPINASALGNVSSNSVNSTTQNVPDSSIATNNVQPSVTAKDPLKEIGSISVKDSIMVNGVKNQLYKTFDDKQKAMEDLKSKIPELLKALADKYSSDSIDETNWKVYRGNLGTYEEELFKNNQFDYSSEIYRQISVLEAFFDIYENNDTNAQVLDFVNTHENGPDFTDQLALLLPYTSPLYQSYNNTIKNKRVSQVMGSNASVQSISGFNAYDGYIYAQNHAEESTVNSSEYGYLGENDCTNFVSQILEKGGVAQNSTWWHSNILGYHLYSDTWVGADRFAKYLGVRLTSRGLYYFSVNLTPGDFIAFDRGNDGGYDHCAFVCQTGTVNTYSGKYYQDFKVAQHSDCYYAWASEERNHWDLLEDQNCTYAILG